MTTPGGGEYLPPIVQRLLGDNSDFLDAFDEAIAKQDEFVRSTRDMGDEFDIQARRMSSDADDLSYSLIHNFAGAEQAIDSLRHEMDGLDEDIGGLGRTADRAAPRLAEAGRRGGVSFLGGIMQGLAGLPSMMVPLLIGGAVLAAPVISALIGSAVAVGIGLGFVGLGALLIANFSASVKASFATIGKNFKRAIGGALYGEFDDALKRGLSAFNRMIPTFGQQFRRIFDALAPALEPLASALGEGLKGFLAEMMQVIPQIMPALLTFIGTIPDMMRAVGEFLAAITRDGPALSRFISDASNAIIAFLLGAGEVISWLTKAYDWIVKLNDAWEFIGWSRHLEGLKIAAAAVGNFFVSLWGKITEGGGKVTSWFAGLPDRIAGFLASLPGRATAFMSDLANKMAYWLGWLAGRWLIFLTELPSMLGEAFTAVIAWALRIQHGVTEKIGAAVGAAVDFFRKLPGRLIEQSVKLRDRVLGFFAKAHTWLGEAGKDTVRGFIEGVIDLGSWAIDKVKGFAGSIIKGFKDALEIGSPSKKFGEAGAWSAIGYVNEFAKVIRGAGRRMGLGVTATYLPGAPSGAPRPYAGPPPAGGGGGGGMMLEGHFYLDGQRFATAVTPAVQRRGQRSGTTGLGAPAAGLM